METVRIAFIGAGALANSVHYPSLAECEDAELVAICDLDQQRLNRTADKYGVRRRYADYRRMLDEVECEAVYIIMPPMPLRPIALDCLAAGRHVVTEKPPGCTSEDTLAIAEAAQKHGLKTMCLFNRRFSRVVQECKRRVEAAGGPRQAMSEFHKNMVGQQSYYGLSILTCDIIHVVDCMRWFLGDAVEVHRDVRQVNSDWDNVFNALIRFDSGACGLLSACRVAGSRYERFELHGVGISCYIRAPQEAEIRTSDKDCELLRGAELVGSSDSRMTYGYFHENRYFIDCVKNGIMPMTSYADALQSIRLCEWIQYGKPLA